MGAVQRTIEQVIADAWGNNDGGVTVHVLDEVTHLEIERDLTPEEARAFAATIVLAADAVTAASSYGSGEPPAPRGDTITPSAHRRAESVAKAPQIAAEAQRRCTGTDQADYPCHREEGHGGWCRS